MQIPGLFHFPGKREMEWKFPGSREFPAEIKSLYKFDKFCLLSNVLPRGTRGLNSLHKKDILSSLVWFYCICLLMSGYFKTSSNCSTVSFSTALPELSSIDSWSLLLLIKSKIYIHAFCMPIHKKRTKYGGIRKMFYFPCH